MNNRSEQAQLRSKLFINYSERNGAVVLPGRWGGDFNNDQLAIYQTEGGVVLLLGLKTTSAQESEISLDTNSLGSYVQFSAPWLRSLILCLRQDEMFHDFADMIEKSWIGKTLIGSLLVLDTDTEVMSLLRIDIGLE